jgi:RsiW-degrading membrane proteinase PrsW (M82 family)
MSIPPGVPPSSPYGGPPQPNYPPQQQHQQQQQNQQHQQPQYQPEYQQPQYQQPYQQAPGPGGYPNPAYGYEPTLSFQGPSYYPNQWGFIPPPVRVQSAPNPVQLIPLHHWFKDRSLRNWLTILFVLLVLTPTAALYVQGAYPNLVTQTAWAFAVYFAGLWLVILWVTVRPPMVRPWMLAEIAAIGLILETPVAVWMEEKLNTGSDGIFSMIFTVGFPEETVKVLPVLVLAVVHRKQWASLLPKDYLFIGAVSGLAFGASEAVLYTTQAMPAQATSFSQSGASPAQIAYQAIFEGAWRLLTDPISHAIWAGIAAYFIGLAVRYERGRLFVAVFGLTLVALLHGINDRLAENGDWGWIVEVGLSVVLFIGYVQAGGVVEHELERDPYGQQPGDPAAGAAGPAGVAPATIPGQTAGPPGSAQPAPGYGQWAPVPGAGYPVGAAPTYVQPVFNPADGWGSTGFTQIPGARRSSTSAHDLAMSQSRMRMHPVPQQQPRQQPQPHHAPPQQEPAQQLHQHQQQMPPVPQQHQQQQQGQPTAQYPGQYPQHPQSPQTPPNSPPNPPLPPPNPQGRRNY